MKKEKLINAIKETIIDLETGRKKYQWSQMSSCNCGLLAVNLGATQDEFLNIKGLGDFECLSQQCSMTQMQIPALIGRLLDAGLSHADIQNLERLKDQEVLKLTDIYKGGAYYTHKENVLKYFRAWLRILEREEKPAPQELPYRTVVIDSKVKSLTEKEIIYS